MIEAIATQSSVTLVTQDEEPHELPLPGADNLFVDFVRSVEEGREGRVPAEDCFRMTEVVLKAREAAQTGKPVAV